VLSILIPNKMERRIHEVLADIDELFPGSQAIVAVDREGRGKGWAVRTALEYAKGDVICFLDGDMDIEPRMIKRLLPFLADYDIVVGRKQIRGIPSRRILTRLSRWFIQALFGLGIDTQTGIKLFKREALSHWDSDGFMFDLEILAKARIMGARIIEVPVEAVIERKMNSRSIIKCLNEAIKIRSNLKEAP
jgi:glycosyltransferase involved in cell wall biosynthesis